MDGGHDRLFANYAAERREQIRRLRLDRAPPRCGANSIWRLDGRRTEVCGRFGKDRSLALPLLLPCIGLPGVPDKTFEEPTVKKLLETNGP